MLDAWQGLSGSMSFSDDADLFQIAEVYLGSFQVAMMKPFWESS